MSALTLHVNNPQITLLQITRFYLLLLDPLRNRSNSLPNSSANGSKLSSPKGFHSDMSADNGRKDPPLEMSN